MATVTVRHLGTNESKIYTCSPREAVIAAYAQARGDFNTWDYEQRYGHMVVEGKLTVAVGDWAALKGTGKGQHGQA